MAASKKSGLLAAFVALLAILMGIVIFQSSVPKTAYPNADYHDKLIDELRAIDRITGPSYGGPHVGIGHNATTRKIVAEGKTIVPKLIDEINGEHLASCIYSLFCLRELRATEAVEL